MYAYCNVIEPINTYIVQPAVEVVEKYVVEPVKTYVIEPIRQIVTPMQPPPPPQIKIPEATKAVTSVVGTPGVIGDETISAKSVWSDLVLSIIGNLLAFFLGFGGISSGSHLEKLRRQLSAQRNGGRRKLLLFF